MGGWSGCTEDPDPPDGGEGEGGPGFRRYPHSKDHRKDLPQIVIDRDRSPEELTAVAAYAPTTPLTPPFGWM